MILLLCPTPNYGYGGRLTKPKYSLVWEKTGCRTGTPDSGRQMPFALTMCYHKWEKCHFEISRSIPVPIPGFTQRTPFYFSFPSSNYRRSFRCLLRAYSIAGAPHTAGYSHTNKIDYLRHQIELNVYLSKPSQPARWCRLEYGPSSLFWCKILIQCYFTESLHHIDIATGTVGHIIMTSLRWRCELWYFY